MDRGPAACPLTGGHSGGEREARLKAHLKVLTRPRHSLPFDDGHGSPQTNRCFLPPWEVWILEAVHKEMDQ